MASPLQPTDRREFLKAAAGAAAVMATPGIATAEAAPASAPTAETYAKLLYESLSPAQREAVCFDWDHVDPKKGLLRTRVEPNWYITERVMSHKFFNDDQRELVRQIMQGIYSPEWLERVDTQMMDDAGGWEESTIALFGKPGEKFEFVMTGRHLTVRCDGNTSEHVAFGGPIFYGHAAEDFNEEADHPGNVYWSQAVAANKLYQMLDGEQQEAALVRRGLPRERGLGSRAQEGGASRGYPCRSSPAIRRSTCKACSARLWSPTEKSTARKSTTA